MDTAIVGVRLSFDRFSVVRLPKTKGSVMPRKRNAVPKYLFHISGQALVSIAGRDFYLGKYGSPEEHTKNSHIENDSNALIPQSTP